MGDGHQQAIYESDQSTTGPRCDDGHGLHAYCPACSGFCCELCGEDLDEGFWTWRCSDCGGLTFCVAVAVGGFGTCVDASAELYSHLHDVAFLLNGTIACREVPSHL